MKDWLFVDENECNLDIAPGFSFENLDISGVQARCVNNNWPISNASNAQPLEKLSDVKCVQSVFFNIVLLRVTCTKNILKIRQFRDDIFAL